MKKKRIYGTCVSIVMIILIYSIMFGFSAQTGEESGGLSFLVSQKIVKIADFFSIQSWTMEEVDTKAETIEFFVRKMAHFAEYAALGFFWFGLAVMWLDRGKKRVVMIAGIILLSGMVDEVHQMFVPGRYPSVWDVLLDTAGGLSGMYLLSSVVFLLRARAMEPPINPSLIKYCESQSTYWN